MKVLVCGGRNYGTDGPKGPQYRHIITTLEVLASKLCPGYPSEEKMLPDGIEIISGGATGADTVVIDWAVVNWLPFKEYKADWDDLSHPDAIIRTRRDGSKYDARAGLRRNQKMLDEGKPDMILAFPGGTGTADMVRRAHKAMVLVEQIKE